MTQTLPASTDPTPTIPVPQQAPPRTIPAWAAYRPPHQETQAPKPRGQRRAADRSRGGLLAAGLGIGLVLVVLVAAVTLLVTEVRDLNDQLDTQVRVSTEAQQEFTEQIDAATAAANGLSERLGQLEARVDDQPDLAKVAGQVEPSVFTVVAGNSQGSAFVFQQGGGRSVLVTNFHVIQEVYDRGGRRVDVAQDNRRLSASVDRVSPDEDLAVLSVDSELPVLTRSTRAPAVGDPVLAFGSPLGLGGSASNGIVSALRPGRIQFSAPVSPGNSGGPLVDRRGEVIGVTTSKLVGRGSEGISFAIPISQVCSTVVTC